MGSRKNRLENEFLRKKQAEAETIDRSSSRLALCADVKKLLDECKAGRQAMRRARLQELKQYRLDRQNSEKNRKQRTAEAQKARVEELNERSRAVQASLKQFHTSHKEMSDALQNNFQESKEIRLATECYRKNQAAAYTRELTSHIHGLQQDTRALLKSFNASHQDTKKQQHISLSAYIQEVKAGEALRKEQAVQDMDARREFLFELLDLDFGLKKNLTNPILPP
jgi:cysteinyl-tRNA synthetase